MIKVIFIKIYFIIFIYSVQARDAAKAKSLRAKFERWEAQENEANQTNQSGRAELVDTENASLESAKSLRARFESLQQDTQQPKEAKTPRPKVNRFVVRPMMNITKLFLFL